MQRVFINSELSDQVILTNSDYHHLVEVLRYRLGKKFQITDPFGNVADYGVEAVDLDKKQLIAKLIQKIDQSGELPVDVTLICALTKGKKIDETVEKCTEFGAHHFVFYYSKFSQGKYSSEWANKKEERLNKIALTAARQSHRNVIPDVSIYDDVPWEQINSEHKFLAYEKTSQPLKKHLEIIERDSSVCCAFGPEGGFSPEEVKLYSEHGFNSISLGKRILRAENAPLLFLSVLSFYFEI